MPTDLARQKYREASFFLGEMAKREGSPRLDQEEEFGYFLSAFLSAARSVSFVLRKENPLTYEAQSQEWLRSLTPSTRVMVDFMRDQRNAALKEGLVASERNTEHVPASVADRSSSRSHYSTTVIVQPYFFAEGATIAVARYTLSLEGRDRPAVETCRDYLAALELLVSRF
jgi:hypothetical protein